MIETLDGGYLHPNHIAAIWEFEGSTVVEGPTIKPTKVKQPLEIVRSLIESTLR